MEARGGRNWGRFLEVSRFAKSVTGGRNTTGGRWSSSHLLQYRIFAGRPNTYDEWNEHACPRSLDIQHDEPNLDQRICYAVYPTWDIYGGRSRMLANLRPERSNSLSRRLDLGGDNWLDAIGPLTQSPGLAFDNLTMYDPFAKQWYWQITTGNRPTPRHEFCAAGVLSPQGTYEMYKLLATNIVPQVAIAN